MIPLAAGLISAGAKSGAAKQVVSGVGDALGKLGIGANKLDKERIEKARRATAQAIAGDHNAAQLLLQGSRTWATQVGKDAARAGWNEVQRVRPDVAAVVLPQGMVALSASQPMNAKSTADKLKAEVNGLWDDVREATAKRITRVGAGATNAAADAVAPKGKAGVAVPLSTTAIAGIVFGVLILAGLVYMLARRK